ncbi:MAG: hypothetical protein ACO2XQ_06895 [Flavobacteriales bacterium]
MLLKRAADIIAANNPSTIEINTPHKAALIAAFAFRGSFSLSTKYMITPTIGIKKDNMFKPADGISFEFEIVSSVTDSKLGTTGAFFSIKSEIPNKIKAIF